MARTLTSAATDWARQRVSPIERARRAEFRATFTPPADLPAARRKSGSVWAVTNVKNERDVIESTIRHLIEQGVDGVLVSDNGSTDGTVEILRGLAREYPIYVAHDPQVAFYQATKTTALSAIARRAGADWIVPFDADEFWFAPGMSVAEHLRSSTSDVVRATLHNMFPLSDTGAVSASTIYRLDQSPGELGKVAFRSHMFARLMMGNHDVVRHGPVDAGLVVAHLPWRSFDQFKAKLAQGKKAMEATTLGRHQSRHWRTLGDNEDEELRALWGRLLVGEGDTIAWSPVGPFQQSAVLSWRSWPTGQAT